MTQSVGLIAQIMSIHIGLYRYARQRQPTAADPCLEAATVADTKRLAASSSAPLLADKALRTAGSESHGTRRHQESASVRRPDPMAHSHDWDTTGTTRRERRITPRPNSRENITDLRGGRLAVTPDRPRAGIYARVSRDDRPQDGRNLAGQIDMGRDYCAQKGYTPAYELAEDDRGASGADTDLPMLNKARELARAGLIEVLVVREIDRLSRNLPKQLQVEEELRRYGVRIEYVLYEYPSTPEGELMKNMKAAWAQFERDMVRTRCQRGMVEKVKAGSVHIAGGNAPLGYKLVRVARRDRLEIVESEAATVRLIFLLYTEGGNRGPLTIKAIAQYLSALGVPSPDDLRQHHKKQMGYGHWGGSSVANILKNTTYSGTWLYGKKPHQHDGRVRADREACIPVSVPAIVSPATWEKAQKRLGQNLTFSLRNTKEPYLLRRRLTCNCGCDMGSRSMQNKRGRKGGKLLYYYCRSMGRAGETRTCHAPYARADHVDRALWAWVRSLIDDPSLLARTYAQRLDETDRLNAPIRAKVAALEARIGDNTRLLARLLNLYIAEDLSRAEYLERRQRLESENAGLGAQRDQAESQLSSVQSLTDEAGGWAAFVGGVRAALDALEDESGFELQARIIETLDLRARLSVEDGQRLAHIRLGTGLAASIVIHNPVLSPVAALPAPPP